MQFLIFLVCVRNYIANKYRMDGPTHIGEWQRISDLGSGAFGVVSLWKNGTNEDCIAIKKCKFHTTSNLTEKQKTRWNNEVHIMKIINHPNIIKYKPIPSELEAGILKYNPTKLPLLPMEYCRKGNLRRILCRTKNICGLQEEDVRCVLQDISSGLQHLHRLKITHRDIKPDNIVLDHCSDRKGDTIYKIIDLGYAKELNDTVVSFVGTLHYLAPEIFQNIQYNVSVDYWSMGILTFEVICGVLPFLPHLSPFERFDKIQKKGPDDICIYRSYSGRIAYSSEIKRENFMSNCLKPNIESWLRHVLQFDPNKRSETCANNLKVFEYLDMILKKSIVKVFSIHKLEFYSYEISESTLIGTLKDWISRDIKICKDDLILLLNKNTTNFSDSSFVDHVLQGDNTIFVFKKGVLVNENVAFNFPKLLREVFKSTRFDNSYIRQLYAETIYYVTVEKTIIEAFRKSLSLFVIYLQNLIDYLRKSYTETSHTLLKLFTKLECYNSIRKNNICDINLSKNCEYKDCLICCQKLITNFEISFLNFKNVGPKIMFIAQKQKSLNETVLQMRKLLGGNSIDALYEKVLNLIDKNTASKQPNGKILTSDIKDILSETIKIKDRIIHDKDVKSYLSSIAKIHNSAENLKSWMIQHNNYLGEISKSFEKSEIVYRNIIAKATENNKRSSDYVASFDGELLNLPSEYLIQENKELRYKFEDILSNSILHHKNYVASVKTYLLQSS